MTPQDPPTLATREDVESLRTELVRSREERRTEIRDVKATLIEVKTQVEKTNGRVTGLERWRDRVLGAATALGVIYAIANDALSHLLK